MSARRPRILVLNQYYWPGVEATAHLLSDLCEALADDFDITIVTGMLNLEGVEPGPSERNGVAIRRVASSAHDRAKLGLRALNYLTYIVESLRTSLRETRPDAVLCMTDPPMIGDIALVVARRFRVPLVVVSQDVFPEIAVQLGRLQNPLLVGLLDQLVRFYLRRADRVVAIGERMRERLEGKGAPAARVSVIPNWVDTTKLTPLPKDNPWARANGLVDKFVVMHSGNVGWAQNLDALIRSATFLRDLEDLRIVIIGNGARRDELGRLAKSLEVDRVVFMPYQPRETLSQSLSAADLHVVGLASGLSGYVVPSRLYGILSVGRPVLVGADADCETARVVTAQQCGIVTPPGRPELLARAIRAAHAGELDLAGMGERSRAYVTSAADRSIAVAAYRALLHGVVARGR